MIGVRWFPPLGTKTTGFKTLRKDILQNNIIPTPSVVSLSSLVPPPTLPTMNYLSRSMSSSLSLPLNPALPHKAYFLSPQSHSCLYLLFKRSSHSLHCNSLVAHCSNNPTNEEQRWLREEQRWLREEQRWLREEQRWLREEQRWARERDSLLHQIADLNLQIQAVERRVLTQDVSSSSAVLDAIANVTALLQVLKEKNNILIADSGVNSWPMVPEEKREAGKEIEKEVVVEETARVPNEKNTEKRNALRKGSEGDDVREMQVCLQYEFLLLRN